MVAQSNMVKVFTFTATPTQMHVFDTSPNPKGLVALSPSSERSILAFPKPGKEPGAVQIVNLADPDETPAR